MYAYITISNVGADAGPFNLYTDLDGYISAFETDIPRASLEAGYATNLVPDGTTIIKIQSVNTECNNFLPVSLQNPLVYYFEPQDGSTYMNDFILSGTYTYVYGYWNGYFSETSTVPGNHIVKLNPDRSVDATFDIGQGPEFHIVYLGATLTELPDLSLIFVGFFLTFNGATVNRILKLLPDGTRDPSFVTGIGFNNYTTSVQRDTSGRLYITGIYNEYDGSSVGRGLVRLLADGSLDNTYDSGVGFNNASVYSLLNTDNSMYISGYFTQYKGISCPTGIIKVDEDANVDPSFDGGIGFDVGNLEPISMARITGESSFYCAGYFTQYKGINEPYIIKLDENGDKDTSFDAGTGFDGVVGAIKVIWGDRLFVTGYFNNYNGTASIQHIILYKDGTVYKSFPTVTYTNMYIIGNEVFATDYADPNYYNVKIWEHDPSVTTTTTTTV